MLKIFWPKCMEWTLASSKKVIDPTSYQHQGWIQSNVDWGQHKKEAPKMQKKLVISLLNITLIYKISPRQPFAP